MSKILTLLIRLARLLNGEPARLWADERALPDLAFGEAGPAFGPARRDTPRR
ncbi:MAG: hypothetical protein KF788_06535 [Piscinibacter sp.]|nr:hypothetical protein [Piscinibacter sp.]